MRRMFSVVILIAACGGTNGGGDPDAPGPTIDSAVPTQLVEELVGLTTGCGTELGGLYATDSGDSATVRVCGLVGAVYWTADMDIDCDGIETTVCNAQTDGAYQPNTSAQTSTGEYLDASTLPYVVIPLPSARFTYADHMIDLGTVVGVIYNGQIQFGVFGDQGPDDIIGEASYRMAQLLGIDPDPSNGGTDGPVTYIAFTGSTGMVTVMEDHDEAATIGAARAQQLVDAN
jgi:hypothetical protein